MDEHDSERLKASVGEYLEALERLDLLRPRMLGRPHDVTPSSEDLADCWNAAAAVKCALRGLRQYVDEQVWIVDTSAGLDKIVQVIHALNAASRRRKSKAPRVPRR